MAQKRDRQCYNLPQKAIENRGRAHGQPLPFYSMVSKPCWSPFGEERGRRGKSGEKQRWIILSVSPCCTSREQVPPSPADIFNEFVGQPVLGVAEMKSLNLIIVLEVVSSGNYFATICSDSETLRHRIIKHQNSGQFVTDKT